MKQISEVKNHPRILILYDSTNRPGTLYPNCVKASLENLFLSDSGGGMGWAKHNKKLWRTKHMTDLSTSHLHRSEITQHYSGGGQKRNSQFLLHRFTPLSCITKSVYNRTQHSCLIAGEIQHEKDQILSTWGLRSSGSRNWAADQRHKRTGASLPPLVN